MEFREKLRKLRLERGLSQQELADGIFVSRSAVAKWENGLGLPSEASREALAAFFGVPAADLRTEEPEAVILEKNRKLRRRAVSASTVTAILLVVLVCLNSWQSRRSARLREAMGQMDLRMEMAFEGARVLLGQEFREAAEAGDFPAASGRNAGYGSGGRILDHRRSMGVPPQDEKAPYSAGKLKVDDIATVVPVNLIGLADLDGIQGIGLGIQPDSLDGLTLDTIPLVGHMDDRVRERIAGLLRGSLRMLLTDNANFHLYYTPNCKFQVGNLFT